MAPFLVPIRPSLEIAFKYQKLHFNAPPSLQVSSLLFIASGNRYQGREKVRFDGLLVPSLGASARAQIEVLFVKFAAKLT